MSAKVAPNLIKNTFKTLTTHLPSSFRSRHCFEIYSPNVIFVDKIRNKKIQGLTGYVIEAALLQIYFNLKYKFVQLKILKVSINEKDSTIDVRWRLIGVKGFSIFFGYFGKQFNKETCSIWLDGHSKFEVGSDGKIFKHTCDKVITEGNLEKLASNGKIL